MKISDAVRAVSDHVDRLMREAEAGSPNITAPERSMARPKPSPVEEPIEPELPRPWAEAPDAISTRRSSSRLAQLRTRLQHPETLQEAIILKEIFDRPLARRRR